MKLKRAGLVTIVLTAIFVIAAVAMSQPARAQACSTQISVVNFGSVTPSSNINFDTSATVHVNCTGPINMTVRACPNIDGGTGGFNGTNRIADNGSGHDLEYNLFSDAARTQVWGSAVGGTGSFEPPPVDIALNSHGQGSTSVTIYGRIFAGQTGLPADFYQSALTITTASVDASTNPTCAGIGATNARYSAVSVSANSVSECAVTAAALNFGALPSISSGATSSTTITAQCTSGTPYRIALNGGLSNASDPTARIMTRGNDQLTYGLYRDSSHSQVWGETFGSNTASNTGNGSAQNFTVYGRIHPQQSPPVGTYNDTVIVTVDY